MDIILTRYGSWLVQEKIAGKTQRGREGGYPAGFFFFLVFSFLFFFLPFPFFFFFFFFFSLYSSITREPGRIIYSSE